MGGGYEGAKAFRRRTFGIFGEGSILRAGTVSFCLGYFSGLEFGWTIAGGIGCWDFWAQGPGMLTESWS
jgi:hypothetical protein